MQGWVNYARGWVFLTVCGPFPERFINLCAQQKVTFWGVEWLDGQTLRLTLLRRDRKKAEELAARAGCTVELGDSAGLPAFLVRFRRRYAFLIGLTASVLCVCLLSNFVLSIEVTGNEQVPDAVILSQVRRLGLHTGVYGPKLDTKQIALDTQLALEELSWVSVNLYGTRAQVVVRERVEPPELLEKEGVSDIVSEAGGLILRVDAVEGQAKVKVGDMVMPGDILISGTVTMEGPQYSDVPPRYLHVRAAGSVWARTWRTLSAVIPVETTVKEYTGADKNRWSVTIFGRRINFYGNSSILWEDYDKISKTHCAVLPGGQRLPFSFTRETLKRWTPVRVQVNPTAAQELLEAQLKRRLEQLVGEDGRVVTVDWSARISGGMLTVTGVAECEEQIGRAQKTGTE
ncbi:MAG: sporulation protein [Ruminococcaceae bacterium]|nr:sporulation protein [Oscillospiraceae bacterium]